MKTIVLGLVVAVIVEALVEYGQTIYEMVQEMEYKKAIKQGMAIVIAVVFAFAFHITLMAWITTQLGEPTDVSPSFDMIVSGIFMSRGANYLSDFIRMIFRVGTDTEVIEADDDEEDEDDEAVEE